MFFLSSLFQVTTSAQLTTEAAQDFAFQSALIETAHAQMDSNLMRKEQLVSQVISSGSRGGLRG